MLARSIQISVFLILFVKVVGAQPNVPDNNLQKKLIVAVDRQRLAEIINPGSKQMKGHLISGKMEMQEDYRFDGVGVLQGYEQNDIKYSLLIGIYADEQLAKQASASMQVPKQIPVTGADGSLIRSDVAHMSASSFIVRAQNVVAGCLFEKNRSPEEMMPSLRRALDALQNRDVVKLGPEPKAIKAVDRKLNRLSVKEGMELPERIIPKTFVVELKLDSNEEILLPRSDDLRGSKTKDGKYLFIASRNAEDNPISLRFARKTGEVTVVEIHTSELKQVTRTKNTDEIKAAESQPATNAS